MCSAPVSLANQGANAVPRNLRPGVYVEEVPGGARPITAVGTSTAAFLGQAPDPQTALRVPTAVASFGDFKQLFVKGEAAASGGSALANAVAGFFANGGSSCYVVNLGAPGASLAPDDLLLLDAIDGISLVAAPGYSDAASHEALIGDGERRGDRFAILDTPADIDPLERFELQSRPGDAPGTGGLRPRSAARGLAAIYTPWIVIDDALSGTPADQPPSGHVAGLYARIDAQRGVHQAPANAVLVGALGLTRSISRAEQEGLNSLGINCIRAFHDGIKVWGARTLAESASEWRYVPIRRLVTMISRSIELGTRWVVFEPNDEPLWQALRRDIGAFLHTLWRDGALAGSKPEEAYFVRCDASTITQVDIDNGRVVALIGIAPTRPAEFVVLRLVQSKAESLVHEG
jgi:phage tail sheath protein FI